MSLRNFFFTTENPKMEKMTVRKMLERTVVATNKREVKNIFQVSSDGEIVKAEFAVDLIQTLTDWNFLWEVTVIFEKFYEDRFVVIFDSVIEQINGDPDKGDTWFYKAAHRKERENVAGALTLALRMVLGVYGTFVLLPSRSSYFQLQNWQLSLRNCGIFSNLTCTVRTSFRF